MFGKNGESDLGSVIVHKTNHMWYLHVSDLYEGETPAINWKNVLEPGQGTKHQRSYLISSFKGLIDAMVLAPRITKGRLAHGTVLNWVFLIQRMVRWMVARNIWRFSALSASDLKEYIEWSKVNDIRGGEVSQFTFDRKIAVLQEMWDLRALYIAGLRVNPRLIAPVVQCPARKKSSWKPLREEDALQLIRDAIMWLDTFGDYIQSIGDRIWVENGVVGLTTNQRRDKKTIFHRNLALEPEFKILQRALSGETQKLRVPTVISRAINITDGACITLILFLEGMRIREVGRLDSGCVRTEKRDSGESITRIFGVAGKRNGKARSWVTCEEVIKAINYLDAFYAKARKSSGLKALIVNRRTSGSLSPFFRVYRSQPHILTDRLRLFVRSPHRKKALDTERVHPHRARKTFARFVVLRDKSALESLAFHYGHMYQEITDINYVGRDIELSELIEEEGRKDLENGLTDLLSAAHVSGKGGQALSIYAKNQPAKLRGKLALKKTVNLLIEKGVQLAPCDWGYCVYSQSLSACQGDEKGPNKVRRSADVCSTCSNFAVTERHRAWWERRFATDEKFLKQSGLPDQTIIWVERRLQNTSRVIGGLNRPDDVTEEAGDISAEE